MTIEDGEVCPHCGEVPLDVIDGEAECPNCGSVFAGLVICTCVGVRAVEQFTNRWQTVIVQDFSEFQTHFAVAGV